MSEFFICDKCGSMLNVLCECAEEEKNCKEALRKLEANSTEAATEKHIPAVTVKGNEICVQVGSTEHPMAEEHFIMWVYLETEHGGQFKRLNPGEAPRVKFTITEDKPVAVYEYCNIHGLWKKDL